MSTHRPPTPHAPSLSHTAVTDGSLLCKLITCAGCDEIINYVCMLYTTLCNLISEKTDNRPKHKHLTEHCSQIIAELQNHNNMTVICAVAPIVDSVRCDCHAARHQIVHSFRCPPVLYDR